VPFACWFKRSAFKPRTTLLPRHPQQKKTNVSGGLRIESECRYAKRVLRSKPRLGSTHWPGWPSPQIFNRAVRAFPWRQGRLPTDCALARHAIAVIANEADPTPPDLWPYYPGQRRSEARGRLLLRGALTIGLSALQHSLKESTPHNGHNAGVTVGRTRLIEVEIRRFANVLPSKPRLSDTSGPDGLSHRPGFFYASGQLPHMIAIEKWLNLT